MNRRSSAKTEEINEFPERKSTTRLTHGLITKKLQVLDEIFPPLRFLMGNESEIGGINVH
jgi:hypothetical protein